MLAGLGAADQLAPFDHANLGLDANLGQVGLQQLGAEVRVGVQQAAGRAGPYRGFETVLEPGAAQQGLGFGEVLRVAWQLFGIAPGVRRVDTVGRFGGAFEHGLEVAALIKGQVDRLAHFGLVQRWVLAVDGDERGHEGGGFFHLQRRVFFGLAHIQGLG